MNTESSEQEHEHTHHHHDHHHGHGYSSDDDQEALMAYILADSRTAIPPVLDQFLSTVDVGSPQRILDLGCGPGIAAIRFASRFPDATVVGVDINPMPLRMAEELAEAAGVADRTSFTAASFDEALTSAVEPVDLLWASMSLHHTEDPAAALSRAIATLNPGGRITLAEFGRRLTLWSDDDSQPDGLWNRWHDAQQQRRLEHLGPVAANVDWPALMNAEGVSDYQQFECPIQFPAPVGDEIRSWVASHLTRGLESLAERLSPDDKTFVEGLLDPDNPDGAAQSDKLDVDFSRIIYTGLRR